MTDKQIIKDRLRYTKNTVSSNMALVAIVLNVLYFVNIYRSDVGDYYYSWMIGVSIIYNLLFMLTVFLCSEGVKNYKLSYSVVLIIVGALQFVRTQIIPKKAIAAAVKLSGEEITVMGSKQHMWVMVFLVSSGVICIIAGIIGIIKTAALNGYMREIGLQNRNIES